MPVHRTRHIMKIIRVIKSTNFDFHFISKLNAIQCTSYDFNRLTHLDLMRQQNIYTNDDLKCCHQSLPKQH